MDFKKLFGFGSSTPAPPPPPLRPPAPPAAKTTKPVPVAELAILGQWKEPGGSDTTEFRADGTLVEKPASGDPIRGRYWLDGSRLKVRLKGVPEELAFTVVITSDLIEMTDSEGNTTKYRRV